MSSSLLVRRHSGRSGLSISTSTAHSPQSHSFLSPHYSPTWSSSESTTSRSSSVISIATPAQRAVTAAQVRRSLEVVEKALRSVSYSAARESLWEDKIGCMERLDIKPDAYSEPQSTGLDDVEDDDVEVELEVKRARGGSDGQRQTTSLILHRKRRWIRPAERPADLSYYADSASFVRPPLPHPLVVTRSRPAVRCVCQSDGEWQPERLVYAMDDAERPSHPRPVRLPHADLWLERDTSCDGTYTLLANIHSVDSQRCNRTYRVALHLLTLGSDDDEWQKPPIRLSLSHSGSQRSIEARVTTALHTTAYKRLTLHIHAQRIPHAPNFSAIHIHLNSPHCPQLTLTITPIIVRAVECSGVTGQLSVGERHWSEDGEALCGWSEGEADDEEVEEREKEFEQAAEVKRRRVARMTVDLDWRRVMDSSIPADEEEERDEDEVEQWRHTLLDSSEDSADEGSKIKSPCRAVEPIAVPAKSATVTAAKPVATSTRAAGVAMPPSHAKAAAPPPAPVPPAHAAPRARARRVRAAAPSVPRYRWRPGLHPTTVESFAAPPLAAAAHPTPFLAMPGQPALPPPPPPRPAVQTAVSHSVLLPPPAPYPANYHAIPRLPPPRAVLPLATPLAPVSLSRWGNAVAAEGEQSEASDDDVMDVTDEVRRHATTSRQQPQLEQSAQRSTDQPVASEWTTHHTTMVRYNPTVFPPSPDQESSSARLPVP